MKFLSKMALKFILITFFYIYEPIYAFVTKNIILELIYYLYFYPREKKKKLFVETRIARIWKKNSPDPISSLYSLRFSFL